MKTLALIFTLSSVVLACPKNSTEYRGNCFVELKPESSSVDQSKWVSDEAPPKDKMPSYQRNGVKVVDAPTTGADDIKQDQQAQEANAIGQAACEKKYGKGQCGDRGKSPESHTLTLKGTATPQ